jgi:hypothetical protein
MTMAGGELPPDSSVATTIPIGIPSGIPIGIPSGIPSAELPTIHVLVATSSHYCCWCATFRH